MWVRGLKQQYLDIYESREKVAPYVGAWIETFYASFLAKISGVAPYVGAWIETIEM